MQGIGGCHYPVFFVLSGENAIPGLLNIVITLSGSFKNP